MQNVKIENYLINNNVNINDLIRFEDFNSEKKDLEKALKKTRRQLAEIQNKMYAHGKYSVLFCIQGMDTAGKDSLIREVFKDFNVRGIETHSFKKPSELELKHDYLWRHYLALPSRGKFSVFNRTHYENVLVTRVHPEYLLNENIPEINHVDKVTERFWDQRFEAINNFEKHISNNGTIIFKFFLNLSKEEQKYRLLRRLNNPEKQWKFSSSDLSERKLWDNYQKCYQDILNKSSTDYAPWYNIPADNKPAARYIVAQIMLQKLLQYSDIKEPELSINEQGNIQDYINQLEQEN